MYRNCKIYCTANRMAMNCFTWKGVLCVRERVQARVKLQQHAPLDWSYYKLLKYRDLGTKSVNRYA